MSEQYVENPDLNMAVHLLAMTRSPDPFDEGNIAKVAIVLDCMVNAEDFEDLNRIQDRVTGILDWATDHNCDSPHAPTLFSKLFRLASIDRTE